MTFPTMPARRSVVALVLAALLMPIAAASSAPHDARPTGDRLGVIRAAHETPTLAPRLRGSSVPVLPLAIADLPTGTDLAELDGVPDPIRPPAPDPAELDGLEIQFPQAPEVTEFVNSWGFPRDRGRRRHRGTDLMAPKMTEVYALADGVITRMDERRTSGRMLAIEHPNGYTSWYMHLNDDTPGTDDGAAPFEYTYADGLEVGVEVEAGQLVGYVGDSGNAEWGDPHVHFELHRRGRGINPYHTLVAAYEHCAAVWEGEQRIRRYRELTELAD